MEGISSANEGTPLPWKVLGTLCLLMFLGESSTAMCFAYSPNMVRVFGIPHVLTGSYVGALVTTFYFGWSISSVLWGTFSDRYGYKSALIWATSLLIIGTTLLAFSVNYYMALFARLLQGLSLGVAAVCKALIMKITDETNVVLAFTIYTVTGFPLAFVIGPVLAGHLAFPADLYPIVFSKCWFFTKFIIFLPNSITVVGLMATLALEIKFIAQDPMVDFDEEKEDLTSLEESKRLTAEKNSTQSTLIKQIKILLKSRGFIPTVFTYLLLGACMTGVEEMFPVYAATSRRFNGLELKAPEIGNILLGSGAILFLMPIFVIPRLKSFGLRKVAIGALIAASITIPFIPKIYFGNKTIKYTIAILVTGVIFSLQAVAFVFINIMVNNTTMSTAQGLGNGIALMLTTTGRALCGTIYGRLYSWSLTNVQGVADNNDPLGFPFNQYFIFLLLSLNSLLGAIIMICFLDDDVDKPVQFIMISDPEE